MRKIIVSMHITLDGFVSGPNGEFDFGGPDEGDVIENSINELLSRVDTILLGRVAYQLLVKFWPSATTDDSIIADKMNTYSKMVFSKTLENVEWGKWNNARLVKDEIEKEISTLKRKPGKDMVIFGGANIVHALESLGLIDEYHLIVHPVILGSGKPLFDPENYKDRNHLKLLKTINNSGIVLLHYQQN